MLDNVFPFIIEKLSSTETKTKFECLELLDEMIGTFKHTNDLKEQVYDDIRRDSVYDLAQPNDVSPVPSNEAHDQDAVSTTVAPPATSSSADVTSTSEDFSYKGKILKI